MSADPQQAPAHSTTRPRTPASPNASPERRSAEAAPPGSTGERIASPLVPLALPILLLVAGALIGLPWTLDAAVAQERLVGLLLAGLSGLVVAAALARLPLRWLPTTTLVVAMLALAGGVVVCAMVGPAIFRGPLAPPLTAVLGPILGMLPLTDPWAVTNTRFIVGYNGLADLCLVALWAATALVLAGRATRGLWPAAAVLAVVALVVLLGTGSRGGLFGLLAGVWALAVYGWRRGWLVAAVTTPLAIALALLGVLDKGLEVTSTLGRLAFWEAFARLLADYPLTGTGLGVATAYRVGVFYEVNPDPGGLYYTHNTFLQTYMEQGPPGLLGMLLLPILGLLAAWWGRQSLDPLRRGLLLASVGLLVGLETHGLTDQVLTTNLGTGLLVGVVATIVATVGPLTQRRLAGATRRLSAGLALVLLVVGVLLVALPAGRALAWRNVASLQVNQAMIRDGLPDRALAEAAEPALARAGKADPDHPAVLRAEAWASVARFDYGAGFRLADKIVRSPRSDAFDLLQAAHLYRAMGEGNVAYDLAQQAFRAWGKAPPEPVIQPYRQATLRDDPVVRTLAEQAEAALRAKAYDEALPLFLQALARDPGNVYLVDRVGDAERGVYRQQLREGRQTP